MIEHNTAVREAIASPDACHAIARTTGTRTFRLEGTPAGNSRLLFQPTAIRLQAKLGGRIVDYRPRREGPPLDQAAKDAGWPPCPRCGALAAAACRRVGWRGRRRPPHAARLALTKGSEP